MKILHLASFSGNHGDKINHLGFYPWFETVMPPGFTWTRLEIRDFYRGKYTFSKDFISLANESDLVVIGGGNYFETWPQHSRSGVSIDLLPEDYEKIRVPMFINAIGLDTGQGICQNAFDNLPSILEYLLQSERILFSVRNDGSFLNSLKFIGNNEKIYQIPDHGFFARSQPSNSLQKTSNRLQIGINLAQDMKEFRFGYKSELKEEEFIHLFSKQLDLLLNDYDLELNFFAHVHSDMEIIVKVMGNISDTNRRSRINIFEFGDSISITTSLLEKYSQMDLNLVMRFHANIASLSSRVPTFGLINYPQIHNLYSELDLEPHSYHVNTNSGITKIFESVNGFLQQPLSYNLDFQRVLTDLNRKRESFIPIFQKWYWNQFG